MRKSFLFTAFLFCISSSASAASSLTIGQTLTVGQTLVSAGGAFVLGFFSPPNSINRYVGIWYRNDTSLTAVWVANRQSPLTDNSTGALMVTPNGYLVLVKNRNSSILWSTETGGSSGGRYAAQLLDSGNLVVRREDTNISGEYLWQSFNHPTDTLLPGMKIGPDFRSGLSRSLTSWASPSDPSLGNFTLAIETYGVPELVIKSRSGRVWRGGPWNGAGFVGAVPETNYDVFTYSATFHSGPDEIYYSFSTIHGVVARVVIGNDGIDRRLIWFDPPGSWSVLWSCPNDACDRPSVCGPYGFCDLSGSLPMCSCLPGFEPKQAAEWNSGNTSGGCVRVKELGCSRGGGVRDGFAVINRLKLPDTSEAALHAELDLDECRERCLMNCSCTAYASGNVSARGQGCIVWMSGLTDMRVFSNGGQDLYIRQAAADAAAKKSSKWIFAVVVPTVTLLILTLLFCFIKIMRRRRQGNSPSEQSHFKWSDESTSKLEVGKEIISDFFLFQFFQIVEATGNFSLTNKLGEGGFGPVYKGKLLDGPEIAVKRLSAQSGQGSVEFKNEILLIAKLQHRNLVRLLGYCIEGEEKMLIYEFMPNKSLDHFLFDQNQQAQLDWQRRFHIIEGIAQGLLYLHKHSRLTIIHRDLKASNILLDVDMNPKISDFGMARIFSSNELEAITTNKVVGTYGYISPEYALKGHFSTKSDVFSFGVIMLEIITGKRNSSFQQEGTHLNLLALAWKLWKEGNWLELVDASLVGMYPLEEVSRCIHVALLCVQERSMDRPSMLDVNTMLNTDNSTLCYPNQPAFFMVEIAARAQDPASSNSNEVTITAIDGR